MHAQGGAHMRVDSVSLPGSGSMSCIWIDRELELKFEMEASSPLCTWSLHRALCQRRCKVSSLLFECLQCVFNCLALLFLFPCCFNRRFNLELFT